MSQVVVSLKEQQQKAVNQRAQLKDQLEAIEKSLSVIGFALSVQDAIEKESEAAQEVVATPSEN